MKTVNVIWIITLLMLIGCGRNNRSYNEKVGVISVDVKNDYLSKELFLQDFMEVEYIPLESSDGFLCQGVVLDIGENLILVRNESQDGNIFLFDRTGKGVRKINRRGQGGEEYAFMYGAILDEDNGEIFINDIMTKRIMVYDLYGNIKRYFQHNGGIITDNIYDYDKDHLFCELEVNPDSGKLDKSTLVLISKQDGSIVNKIEIYYNEKRSTTFVSGNDFLLYPYCPILPFRGRWILTEASSDTVFCFSPGQIKEPFIVRTPSIQSLNPEIFLFPKMFTDRYYFMERVKKAEGFSKMDLVYDQQKDALYEYTLYNADYSNKQQVNMVTWETRNDEIGFWQKIDAYKLVNSYRKGELKGELKEIAAGLEESSNPVIMLAKNK